MNKKCKRLGNRATKKELIEAHRIKMGVKKILHQHRHDEAVAGPKEWVYANLSKNHEHYGDTPQEHERRKK